MEKYYSILILPGCGLMHSTFGRKPCEITKPSQSGLTVWLISYDVHSVNSRTPWLKRSPRQWSYFRSWSIKSEGNHSERFSRPLDEYKTRYKCTFDHCRPVIARFKPDSMNIVWVDAVLDDQGNIRNYRISRLQSQWNHPGNEVPWCGKCFDIPTPSIPVVSAPFPDL